MSRTYHARKRKRPEAPYVQRLARDERLIAERVATDAEIEAAHLRAFSLQVWPIDWERVSHAPRTGARGIVVGHRTEYSAIFFLADEVVGEIEAR